MKKLTVTISHSEAILGWLYIGVQVFVLPVLLVIINNILPLPFSASALNFTIFSINFICVTVIFHHYLLESARTFFQNVGNILKETTKCFFLYWITSILANYLIAIVDPSFYNVNDDNIAVLANENNMLMLIGTVILVPLVEEILYRGVVFGTLYQKNPVLAYALSVAIFASLHIFGYIGMYSPMHLFLCFLQYIPAGVTLALVYEKTNTIFAPVMIHMVVNLIGMLAM